MHLEKQRPLEQYGGEGSARSTASSSRQVTMSFRFESLAARTEPSITWALTRCFCSL